MTIRDQLIWKALVALDEVAEQARHAPVVPTSAIRFALAFLYATGKGERWMHDTFWREIQRPTPEGQWCHRGTAVQTAMNGIMLNAGMETSLEVLKALEQGWAREPAADAAARRMAAAVREEHRLRMEAAAAKRKARDCGWL